MIHTYQGWSKDKITKIYVLNLLTKKYVIGFYKIKNITYIDKKIQHITLSFKVVIIF